MNTMLENVYTYGGEDESVHTVVFCTEVEVTADTDEESLDDLLEGIREMFWLMFDPDGENCLSRDWNDTEIYRIADSL